MGLFLYKAIKDNKFESGQINAISLEEALFQLKSNELIVIDLEETNEEQLFFEKLKEKSGLFNKKTKNKDILIFTKKFATMVRSGLSITESFEILVDQTKQPEFKKTLEQIYYDINEGSSIADAFSNYPNLFDNIYINMLKAGETSGKFDFFLEKIVENLTKAERIRTQIKSALFYPSMVFLVAVIVVIVMFTKVVPIFLQMYQNMNVSLPVVTQMIIDISNFLRNEIIIGTILGTTLLSFILIKILIKNSYKTRLKLHNFLLKIPLFGDLLLKINLSKISLVLSTLGDAGVSLVESLEIASNSTNNIVLQNVLFDVRRDVFSGENLSTAFAKHTKTIPSILPSMLLVGEKTGDVEHMFHTIATYYDEEVEESIKRIMALIEPIIIVFLGIVVGTIIVAMYMPMFKMGTLVQ